LRAGFDSLGRRFFCFNKILHGSVEKLHGTVNVRVGWFGASVGWFGRVIFDFGRCRSRFLCLLLFFRVCFVGAHGISILARTSTTLGVLLILFKTLRRLESDACIYYLHA